VKHMLQILTAVDSCKYCHIFSFRHV